MRRGTARRGMALVLCLSLVFGFTSNNLEAVNYVPDGTMDSAPTTNWPQANIAGTNTAAQDTTVKLAGTGSLRGTSQGSYMQGKTVRTVAAEWAHTRAAAATIPGGSTVNLSFSYAHGTSTGNATASTLYVEATSDGTNWSTLWSAGIAPTQSRSAWIPVNAAVSSFFTASGDYTIRLRVVTTTPATNGATVSVWWDEVMLDVQPPAITTTIGDGTDPSSSSMCPGGAATMADAFTLTSSSNSTVTAVTVNLGAGASAGIANVAITNDGQTVTYGSVANPATDTVTIPLPTNITSTTTATQYEVVITPKTHAAMTAGTYAVTPDVTGLTSDASTVTANDAGDATITIDHTAPANVTWGTNTAGDTSVSLGWTNPGSDYAQTLILRSNAAFTAGQVPVDGATYAVNDTISGATVVYAGAATSASDTSVANGSTYYYKAFTRDACSTWSTGIQSAALTPQAVTTTVGNGTNPSNAALCPGDAATMIDAFTLQTSAGTNTVSAITVSLAAGTAPAIALIEITNDAGSTVYGSAANPAGDLVAINLGTSITATTTSTQYKVRITPKTDVAMPANGTNYAITGTVTAITASGSKTYNDSASGTLAIDNTAPTAPAFGSNSAGDNYVDLAWTNPSADFAEVVILRNTASITDAPVEGTTYAAGNTIGASSVVYAGTLQAYRDNSAVNGTTYYYKIFARDACGNYSAGTQSAALQPAANVGTMTIGDGSGQSNASLCPGAAATNLDSFTVQNSVGSVAINSVTVTLSNGSAAALALIEVTNDAGTTVYGSVTNPAVDAPTITLGTTINATTTQAQYRVRVTPKAAASMPGNVASPYAVTGIVTAVTSTPSNPKTYSDSTSATLTIDNTAPSSPTWGTNAAGDSEVNLAWTNPATDFAEVVILRGTAAIANAPAEGATYVAGNTIGASTVVYAGTASSYRDGSAVNGTAYYYKIFARDACGNYSTGTQAGPLTPAMVIGTMTVGDGTNPSGAALCPGSGATMMDAFTLRNASGTVQATGITVTLSAGSAAALSKVEITNDDGSTAYGAVNNPATDAVAITLSTNITVNTTLTQFKVRVTPKTHAAMPANAPSPYMVSGTVTAVTSSNAKTYSDGTSATLVIDNSAPAVPVWGVPEVSDRQVALVWTAPGADQVVILRNTSSTATDLPVEGASYTAGQTIGTSAIRYVGSLENFTDTGLTNGTDYYYRIFSRDACGNYSAAVQSSALRPNINVPKVTPGVATYTSGTCVQATNVQPINVSVTFTGDTPAIGAPNSSTKFFLLEGSPNAAAVEKCDRNTASPRTCSIDLPLSTDSTAKTYYVKVRFLDADGVVGPAEQVVGPIQTPVKCEAPTTTALTATATRGACNQIDVFVPFTGDGDNDGSAKVEYNTTNTWPGLAGGCSTLVGLSPRTCKLTGLTGTTAYYVRVTYTDPDGVSGTATQVLPLVAAKTCGADTAAPMAMFLSPTRRAIIGGAERVKVQLFDNVQLAASPIGWLVDATGGTWNTNPVKSTNYSTAICGRSDDPRCGVYEFDIPAFATNGNHYIALQVSDAAGNTSVVTQPVIVKGSGSRAFGLGKLLRRTNSSQLCIDCHTYKGHSSQTAGSVKYGNWGVECLTCHTPHGTTNVGLIRNQIETPNSGMKTIDFRNVDKVGDTNPEFGHLGSSTVAGDGLCESCHTRTLHYRNDTTTAAHYPGARCTNCHGHSSGFKAEACNDCHDAPPAVGPHRKHDEVWNSTPGNVPASYGDAVNHGTATQYGFTCITCHGGTHKNDATVNPTHNGTATNPWLVEVVFRGQNITAPFNGTYAGTYKQAVDQPGAIAYSSSTGTCSNTYCHSNANPVGGTNTPVAVVWNSTATTCSSCHKLGGNGDTGFTATALSKSHNKHIQSASGETGSYTFKCADCHGGTVNALGTNPWAMTSADLKNKLLHVNETKDVVFANVGTASQAAVNYDEAARTCAGSYCHSQGTTTTAPYPAANVNVAWNGTATCVTCHNGNATRTGNVMATGKHGQHVDIAATYGYNVTCVSCHSATVSADETISGFAVHVNGVREVAGAQVGTWGGTATPTCTGSRCHSSGEFRGTPEYYTVNWTSGTITDCKGCHGRMTAAAFTSVAGEPNYASNGTTRYNSHQKHVSAATDCAFCHASTVGTANKIDGTTPAKHMDFDGVPDIIFKGTVGGTYTQASRTCGTNYCHSQGTTTTLASLVAPNNTTYAWGTAGTCVMCHGGAVSTGTTITSGNHAQHVNIAATYGRNLTCAACHSDTMAAASDTAIATPAKHTDFQRQVIGTWVGTWTSPNCTTSKCHSSGEWRTTPEYYSIGWTGATALDCKGCHGRSASAGFFTSVAGEPNYASNGTTRFNSHQKHVTAATACADCHASTVATSNKIDGTDVTKHLDIDAVPDITFKATWGGTYASAGRTCTNNYCHSKGTATYQAPVTAVAWGGTAMNCASCHGGNAGSASPIATPGHAAHVNNAATLGYNLGCIACHSGTVATDTTFASGVTMLGHIDKTRAVAGTYVGTWNGTTCTTSRCHSNGQRLGTPEYYTATWSTETITTCGGCHGRSATPAFTAVAGEPNYATNAAVSRYNSHKAHVSSAADCKTCHSVTVGTSNKIDGTTPTKHMDFDGVPEITLAGGTYNAGTRACTTACHGAGSPVWGGPAMVCGDCHLGATDRDSWNISDGVVSLINSTEWTSRGHGTAAIALPGTNPCVYCHTTAAGHNDGTNPFRLANTTGADGKNGVCLVCHKTGSAGYNPGAGLKNGTKKINSYHYATKHSASANGGQLCWDCHDAHGDGNNIKMIGTSLVKQSNDAWSLSATRTTTTTFTANTAGSNYISNAAPFTGVCNVCHTTAGHYKSTSGDNHGTTAVCTTCHAHSQAAATDAFKNTGGGGDCRGCHGAGTQGTRRAVDADFSDGTTPNFRSHHVGNGTANALKGTLTNFDCVVCHAEGKVVAGATDTAGQPHMDGKIDLRNVDSTTAYFTYDKDAIKASAGTNLAQWSSANAIWRTQTSTALDPFCLGCHDADGATQASALSNATGTALNPFADTAIANNYDQLVRGKPIDIKSKVSGAPPAQGTFSRHAIRGQSTSVYTKYTGTLAGCNGTTACKPIYDYGLFVQNGTDEFGKPNWNDTSVMGCADCHTVDGANGSAGNAHGSTSEYLLKDATGGAAEGTLAGVSYVCFRCHTGNTAVVGHYANGGSHADNGGDYQDYTGQVGTARVPTGNTGGSRFGMACTNCHGGAPGVGSTDGFGWIHGTNQTFYIGYTTTTRNAYRFMNGGSMRFWDPNGWNTSGGTCWTLGGTGRAADQWGGCTKHSGSAGYTRNVTRPLTY